VKVNQENHSRPLASETTGQSKILGLAAGRFVSDTQESMNVSITYIVTPTRICIMKIGMVRVRRDDKHTFGVNGSQVSVLEQGHKVGLSSLLEGHHSRRLEAQVSLHSKHVS
jgi:hypothetical protein